MDSASSKELYQVSPLGSYGSMSNWVTAPDAWMKFLKKYNNKVAKGICAFEPIIVRVGTSAIAGFAATQDFCAYGTWALWTATVLGYRGLLREVTFNHLGHGKSDYTPEHLKTYLYKTAAFGSAMIGAPIIAIVDRQALIKAYRKRELIRGGKEPGGLQLDKINEGAELTLNKIHDGTEMVLKKINDGKDLILEQRFSDFDGITLKALANQADAFTLQRRKKVKR